MNQLLIFCKNPAVGSVKTRLAASIGDEKALAIYLHLLHHTRNITRPLPVEKRVFYSDFIDREDDWENNTFSKALQTGSNLGERMESAFKKAFDEGAQKVCIIGTDCLQLSTRVINEAFDHLTNHDAVLGPATDGGYYLLGLTKHVVEVFRNKEWSTSHVAKDTLEDFSRLNMRVKTTETLSDIDTIEDLSSELKKKFRIVS